MFGLPSICITAFPLCDFNTPASSDINVLLPDPFEPNKPKMSPRSI